MANAGDSTGMQHFDIVAVTHIFRDDKSEELHVKGRRFSSVAAAHSDWVQSNPMYPSLKHIGCYEARNGLNSDIETFPFARLVGKCFPFHMVLNSPACPLQLINQSDQWWTLIRLKHTCPPVTFSN